MKGPDFLFIGAQRTASTWLFQNLRQHPDIWVPPNKSAVYFLPNFQKFRLKKALYYYRDMIRTRAYYDKSYYIRYYSRFFPNDTWYLGLFPDRDTLVTGELAEDYSALPPSVVTRIHTLLPQAKIIFVMRKPWARAISHARLVIKKKKIKNPAVQDYLADIKSTDSKARTLYSRTLKIWEKYYPAEQIFTGFYDDLVDDPERFLKSICVFLGVRYHADYFKDTVESIVNETSPDDIPPEVLRYAMGLYEKETRKLAERFGGPAARWLKEIEEGLR